MIKNKKTLLALVMALTVLCFCACGNGKGSGDAASTPVSDTPTVSAAASDADTPSESPAASVTTEPATSEEADKNEQAIGGEPAVEGEQTTDNEPAAEGEQEAPQSADDGYVKKTQYANDENGIYSFTIVLNDTVPAKGLVEILFYGMNGDTETQVCCYEAEYERGDNGLYEIRRFYDGNIDLNDHQKQELKIPVTFGATVRATRIEATLIVNDSERIALYSLDDFTAASH